MSSYFQDTTLALATEGTRMAEDKDGAQQELRPTGRTDGFRATLRLSRDPLRVRSVFHPCSIRGSAVRIGQDLDLLGTARRWKSLTHSARGRYQISHCEKFDLRRRSGEERLDQESRRGILATEGTRMAEDKDGAQQELRPTGPTDGWGELGWANHAEFAGRSTERHETSSLPRRWLQGPFRGRA
jgi:hypothetical protein